MQAPISESTYRHAQFSQPSGPRPQPWPVPYPINSKRVSIVNGPKDHVLHMHAKPCHATGKGLRATRQQQRQQPEHGSRQHVLPLPRTAKPGKLPLHMQLDQLFAECEATAQHTSSNQCSEQAAVQAGQGALAQLQRLTELWALWETAQDQAARQQPLTSLHSASSQRTTVVKRSIAPVTPTSTQQDPTALPSYPATALYSETQQMRARMEACAQSLLQTVNVFLQNTTPCLRLSGISPLPNPLQVDLAFQVHNPTQNHTQTHPHTVRTPLTHIALNPHILDIKSASALAHAMATTRQYHPDLCVHVEHAVLALAAAHGSRMELRHASRIMAAWARLGHVPGLPCTAALLHASGTVMHKLSSSLTTPPPHILPPAPLPQPAHAAPSTPGPNTPRDNPHTTPQSTPRCWSSLAEPPPHKLQATGRAIVELAWAASQLDVWQGRQWFKARAVVHTVVDSPATRSGGSASGCARGGSKTSEDGESCHGSTSSSNTGMINVGVSSGLASAPLNAALLLLPQRPSSSHASLPSLAQRQSAHSMEARHSFDHLHARQQQLVQKQQQQDSRHSTNAAPSVALVDASRGHTCATSPLELAHTQQAWLDALQLCSLHHLPALNLAGLGQLLQAAARMRMHPCSHAWLHTAAVSVLSATPELSTATPAQAHPTTQHQDKFKQSAVGVPPAAAPSVPLPETPHPMAQHLQPNFPNPAMPHMTPLSVHTLHKVTASSHRPAPPCLTVARLESLTHALQGLAQLWMGPTVFRSSKDKKGLTWVLPGSSLQLQETVRSDLGPQPRLGSADTDASEKNPEGEALVHLQTAVAGLLTPDLMPHVGPSCLAPLLWSCAALGAGPGLNIQGVQVAMERLHGQLPVLQAHHLVLALHAAAMLGLQPYRAWMADWQQQLLRHGYDLSCTDSVRVVCSLAALRSPSKKLGDPVTAVLVDRLSHHLPAMGQHEVELSMAALRQLYRRLRGRPLQQLVQDMQDRLQYMPA